MIILKVENLELEYILVVSLPELNMIHKCLCLHGILDPNENDYSKTLRNKLEDQIFRFDPR